MKKKVKFERWVDPLNTNIQETEWPGFNQNAEGEEQPVHAAKLTQVLHTPFGMLTALNNTSAANQFDFWWMHTNFDITNEIRDIVKRVPGVETLEIGTRYRARIGFPKSGFFAGNQIMSDIQKAITAVDRARQNEALIGLPNTVAHNVIDMRDQLDDKFDNWALLILPNGHIEAMTAEKSDEVFRGKLKMFIATKNLVGGRLLTSEV